MPKQITAYRGNSSGRALLKKGGYKGARNNTMRLYPKQLTKFRVPVSKTKTKTKSKNKTIDQSKTGGLSYSNHKLKGSKAKVNKRLTSVSPLSVYTINASGSLYSGLGTQAANDLTFGDLADWTTYYQTATAGTVIPIGNKTQNLYLKNIRVRLTLTNQSPGDAKVIIYTYRWKNTTTATTTLLTAWNAAVGLQDYSGTNSSSSTVGNDPMKFKNVTNLFKIVDRTTINLSSGAHHQHTSWFPVNKMLDLGRSQTDVYNSGTSFGILIVTYGYPVDQSANLPTAVGITTAPTKIIYTYEHEATMKIMSATPPSKVYREINTYPTAPAAYYAEDEDGNGADQIMTAVGVLQGYA